MIVQKLRAARKLSISDWILLFKAWFLFLLVDVGLRTLPFHRLQALVSQPAPRGEAPDSQSAWRTIHHTCRLVDIASRCHLYTMSCLRRSLVLQWLLARRGLPTVLRFGVNKDDGHLRAHAWLEYENTPVGEPEKLTQRYATLLGNLQI